MKVAFVHDWFLEQGGAEKVLECLCSFYEGPIFTLFVGHTVPDFLSSRPLHTSFLQRIPHIAKLYQNFLPLFPKAIESFDLSAYDLIFSSSHSVAKSVKITRSNQLHICYCHTPMRYAWDLKDFYLKQLNPLKRLLAAPLLSKLRQWDKRTHNRVHHYIANSHHVAKRLQTHYGAPSTVIYPPVDTESFTIHPQRQDYFVTCSRLVPYKRVDLMLAAFAKLPHLRLIVIGDGYIKNRLKAKAPPNVTFLGSLFGPLFHETISKARAFIYAAEEDFGIAMVEAQAAGIPVIAYAGGGALETVLPARTGLFFKEQTSKSLQEALIRFEKMEKDFDQQAIRAHALKFSKERFKREIASFLASKTIRGRAFDGITGF